MGLCDLVTIKPLKKIYATINLLSSSFCFGPHSQLFHWCSSVIAQVTNLQSFFKSPHSVVGGRLNSIPKIKDEAKAHSLKTKEMFIKTSIQYKDDILISLFRSNWKKLFLWQYHLNGSNQKEILWILLWIKYKLLYVCT